MDGAMDDVMSGSVNCFLTVTYTPSLNNCRGCIKVNMLDNWFNILFFLMSNTKLKYNRLCLKMLIKWTIYHKILTSPFMDILISLFNGWDSNQPRQFIPGCFLVRCWRHGRGLEQLCTAFLSAARCNCTHFVRPGPTSSQVSRELEKSERCCGDQLLCPSVCPILHLLHYNRKIFCKLTSIRSVNL